MKVCNRELQINYYQHFTDMTAGYEIFYTSYLQLLMLKEVSQLMSASLSSTYNGIKARILLGACMCLCYVVLPYDGGGLASERSSIVA
jgi:hypothetical protein